MEMLFLMCAVIGSTLLVCQFAMALLGMSDEGGSGEGMGENFGGVDLEAGGGDLGDVEMGADTSHTLSEASEVDITHTSTTLLFQMISLRTVIAAIAFFGIAGKAAIAFGLNELQSLAIALLTGWIAMYCVYSMMRGLARLQSKGNVRITHTIGIHGLVYVPIPANRSGVGKVTLKVQNRTMEYQAQTSEQEALSTGTPIVVVQPLGSDLLLVERIVESVKTIVNENTA